MNGLFGIACLLCNLSAAVTDMCSKFVTLTMINNALCDKINMILGDPDAACPECLPAEAGSQAEADIASAQADTAAAQEVTATLQASVAAVKTILKPAAKKEVIR